MIMRKACMLGILVSLSGCGGPLSLVSYTLASGVALNANGEKQEDMHQDQYIRKCLPTYRKENPVESADRLELSGEYMKAYEYYGVAQKMGYPYMDERLLRVKVKLTPKDVAEAKQNLNKYTDVHIKTCFRPPYGK